MGKITVPNPKKYFASILTGEEELFEPVFQMLEEIIGPRETVSPLWDFDYTTYYEKELGANLKRKFVIFQPLLPTDFLVETKIKTNDLEEKWAESNGCRRLNIDPGYFCLENLILATSKNFTHRIHLGKGIFADLTLIYTKGDYQPNPWTFRDYSEPKVRDFFKQARSGFHAQLKEQI